VDGLIKVTDRVHNNHSFIFLQIAALGRGAFPTVLQEEGLEHEYVSSSPVPISDIKVVPRELTKEEIKEYIDLFVRAAERAVESGFDGVEIHGQVYSKFQKSSKTDHTYDSEQMGSWSINSFKM